MKRIWMAILVSVLICLCGCGSSDQPKFSTEYQAVFLDNGQVFFGRIENSGAAYPLLRDVFYVQTQQDPNTKQVRSILIKRGQEFHNPNIMYLNKQQVVLIEPVTADSKVAQLIKEANGARPK